MIYNIQLFGGRGSASSTGSSGVSAGKLSGGSSNTGNKSTVSLSVKQQKAVDIAKRNLTFDKGYAEIGNNHYSNVGMSNQKMVDALNAKNDGFKYEYKVETTPGNIFTGGAPVKHHRIYRKKNK